jgi:glyoxylase-like metal-dependent hydrolase (beta-lactamase superfamily II)
LSGAEVVRGPIAEVHPADRFYGDTATISLGGNSVELNHISTSHAPDMTVLRFPSEDAVFFVDFLSLKRVPFRNMPGYDIGGLLNAIRAVEAMDFSIAIGGHGAPGNKRDVADHREYLEALRDAVAEGIADGDTLAEIQASVSLDEYDDWASYDDWLPLNVEGMYRMLTGM